MLDTYFTQYTKINSKLIKDPNLRAKTIKLLEDNTGGNLHDPRFGKDTLNMTSKVQATKNKLTSSKLKTFVHERTPSRE